MRAFMPLRLSAARPLAASLALALLSALLPALTGSGNASAQGLGVLGGGSDPGAGTLLERDEVAAAAQASFIEALVRRADEVAQPGYDAALDIADAQPLYERALSAKLDELQGDGALTLAEVSESLPGLRDQELAQFSDIVAARSRGYTPPPRPDQFSSFWPFAQAMARYTLLVRNDAPAWLSLFGAVIGGLVIGTLLNSLFGRLARSIDSSHHRGLYRSALAVRLPLLFGAALLGALIGFQTLWKPTAVEWWVNTGLAIVLAGTVFWAIWNLCEPLSGWISGVVQRISDADIGVNGRLVITRVLRLLAIVALVLVVTRTVIGASLGGILAGLGVAGVVLWFLLRELIENLAASFTLFSDRSVNVGDTIIYDGTWGVIEGIGFRTTRFRTFEGYLVTIPNKRMLGEAVVNVSCRSSVRRRFRLSVAYDTPGQRIAHAATLVRQAIESRGERIARDAGVNVVLDRFGPYDLQLLVQYYAATSDYWEAKHLHDEINRDILDAFAEQGIEIPFPTRTAILRSDDEPARIALSGSLEERGGKDSGDRRDDDRGEERGEAQGRERAAGDDGSRPGDEG